MVRDLIASAVGPIPPTNVTAETRGGTLIPLDGIYLGVEDGIHVWEYTIRGTIAAVRADVLPPMTALRFVRKEEPS